MRRKLAILNLVLLALIGLAGWRIRQTWLDARVRERQMFGRAFKPVPAPLLPAFPLAPPLTAGAYLDVAEKVLFSKDRNPVVVVEAAPEKPMPPLPVFHGVMDLGQGPTVILSEKAKSPHRGYRIGEQVGQFKLVAVDPSELEFEWDGKQVRRKFEELVDKTPPEAPAAQPAAAAAAPAAASSTVLAVAKPSSVIAGTVKAGPAPGKDGSVRGCVEGDSSAPGTVVEGYRKAVSFSPMGKICRWEPVQ